MRTSASPENAERFPRTLRQTVARLRARDLAKVLGGVAAVLLCLELLYLGVGNLLLRSQVIQRAVGSSEGFALEFGKAYTLWPGHAHVENLSLRIEDYNVQFEVALAKADVDIALSQLPFKKFHVIKLRGEGTRFRMRHKIIAIGDDAERIAAFPPIKGFADPPYYVGVHEPPTPPEDYDLWEVQIQDVVARVSELWVMEYRFQGDGLAQGSFVVQPERWVQVEPASLDLTGGTLKLAEHLVAQNVKGRLICDIPDMHVPDTEGVQVLREIIATVKLELSGGKLDFLSAYLGRLSNARYAGNAEWRVDAYVKRGVIEPGTAVELRATPFEMNHELASLRGDAMLSFGRRDDAPELSLAVTAPRIAASRPGVKAEPPTLEGVSGSLTIRGVDLKSEMSLGASQVAVKSARAPSLAWFAPKGAQLSGSAVGSFDLSRSEDRALAGHARLSLDEASYRKGDFAASGDAQSQLAFSGGGDQKAIELEKATLHLSRALLASGSKRSKPFAASVDASGLRLDSESGTNARGSVRLRVSSTEALLPLVMSDPLKGVASTALDLEALEARANVQLAHGNLDVQVVDAASGNLRLKGYLSKRGKQPRGAFLLSTGPINVGVTLSNGETEVSPFVGDDWLASAWSRVGGKTSS